MSTSPEADFDLESLFLPAWAKQPQNQYSQYSGRTERDEGREARGDRPHRRRDQPPGRGPRRDVPGRGPRLSDRGGRGPGPGASRGQYRDNRTGGRPPEGDRRPAPPAPLPEITCAFIPDDRGVESLGKQIKMTGRAYPLFEIAQMILQKPERHSVMLGVRKNAEGQI